MELSERFIRELETEYPVVYEHQDVAGKVYEEQTHSYRSSLYITDGNMTVTLDGKKCFVAQNKRFDIPAHAPHSITIGETGAIYIVGEDT